MHHQKPVIDTQFQDELSSEATHDTTHQRFFHGAQMKSGFRHFVTKALSHCQAFSCIHTLLFHLMLDPHEKLNEPSWFCKPKWGLY
jgi:hypothetical protein